MTLSRTIKNNGNAIVCGYGAEIGGYYGHATVIFYLFDENGAREKYDNFGINYDRVEWAFYLSFSDDNIKASFSDEGKSSGEYPKNELICRLNNTLNEFIGDEPPWFDISKKYTIINTEDSVNVRGFLEI